MGFCLDRFRCERLDTKAPKFKMADPVTAYFVLRLKDREAVSDIKTFLTSRTIAIKECLSILNCDHSRLYGFIQRISPTRACESSLPDAKSDSMDVQMLTQAPIAVIHGLLQIFIENIDVLVSNRVSSSIGTILECVKIKDRLHNLKYFQMLNPPTGITPGSNRSSDGLVFHRYYEFFHLPSELQILILERSLHDQNLQRGDLECKVLRQQVEFAKTIRDEKCKLEELESTIRDEKRKREELETSVSDEKRKREESESKAAETIRGEKRKREESESTILKMQDEIDTLKKLTKE
jgi:hypothetical protein